MTLPRFPAPRQLRVALDLIDDVPGAENPNRLDEADFARLVDAVAVEFGQDVTLMELGNGRYKPVDGVHRCRAARLAGLLEVPALAYPPLSAAQYRWLRLSLNGNRGEPNQPVVHEEVRLLAQEGLGHDLIATAAGLAAEELEALLGAAAEQAGNKGGAPPIDLGSIPDPPAGSLGEAPREGVEEALVLEVPCATAADLAELRDLLKRAGRGTGARGKYRIAATLRRVLRAHVGDEG